MATRITSARKVTAKALAATALERGALLNSIAEATDKLDITVTAWARFELAALRDKRTTFDAIRADACGRFPQMKKNGELSDTPNDSFRSNLDCLKLVACVLGHADIREATAEYRTAPIVAHVTAWLAGGKVSLRTLATEVKAMRVEAKRAAMPKLTKEQREQGKAERHNDESAKLGHAAALNPLALRSIAADLIAAAGEDGAPKLAGYGSVLAELLSAVRTAATALNAAEKATRQASKKAA